MPEDEKVTKLPSARVLQTLAKKADHAKEEADGVAEGINEAIGEAKDKHNVHPGAFKLVLRLRRMAAGKRGSPSKLNELLTHFDDYRAKLKLDDLAGQDMFRGEPAGDEPKGEAETETGGEVGETNVTPIGSGKREKEPVSA